MANDSYLIMMIWLFADIFMKIRREMVQLKTHSPIHYIKYIDEIGGWVSIGPGNGLSPYRRQAITLTNAGSSF